MRFGNGSVGPSQTPPPSSPYARQTRLYVGLKIRVSMVRWTRAIHGPRPAGMLHLSKFAPGEIVRPWPPFPSFQFATSFWNHPRTIGGDLAPKSGDPRTIVDGADRGSGALGIRSRIPARHSRTRDQHSAGTIRGATATSAACREAPMCRRCIAAQSALRSKSASHRRRLRHRRQTTRSTCCSQP